MSVVVKAPQHDKNQQPRVAGERRERLRFNLRRAMFVLPNLFTVSSIFCGFYAMVLVMGNPTPRELYQASLAVFFGLFFDMADGRVARLTRTQSDFGVQLDSLADLTTFGVAPALIVHKWGLQSLGLVGLFGAYTFVTCGALRLARFNVLAQRSQGSKSHFVGLPIPLASGVLISVVMFHQLVYARDVLKAPHVLVLVLVLSYLMVSNIRYRSFKDAKPNARTFSTLALVLGCFAAVAWWVHPAFALVCAFGGYLCFGLFGEIFGYKRRRREDLLQVAAVSSASGEKS